MTKLTDGDNLPENPFTQNGIGTEKLNVGFPYHYLNQILEMSYVDNNVHPTPYPPAPISELNEIVKNTHIFIEAHRQFCENDNKNQAPILYNCFPGFGGITIDEVSSLLYSCGDSCSETSNCHAISPSII